RSPRVGVADRIAARRIFGDGVGIFAVAELGARLLHGAEPGLVDELKQPARRRGAGSRLRIEVGFHLRGGEQIFEAGAGGRRGLLDRARDSRARGIDTCGSRGVCCVDRHCVWCPAPRETTARASQGPGNRRLYAVETAAIMVNSALRAPRLKKAASRVEYFGRS